MSGERVTQAPTPEQSVCPTCGKLLETSHLVQLNRTLELLFNVEGLHVACIEEMTRKIVAQIELVSSNLCAHQTRATAEACAALTQWAERGAGGGK